MGPKVNTKVQAANAKKAAAQIDKDAATQKQKDKVLHCHDCIL
jgi:hypothetical protein